MKPIELPLSSHELNRLDSIDTNNDPSFSNTSFEDRAHLFEAFLDAIPEFIVYYDENLNVIWANRSAAQDAGFSRADMVGRSIFDVTCKVDTPCPGCPVVKGSSSECSEVIENNLVSGRLFYTRTYPVYCRDKKLNGRMEVALDISKLKNRYSISELLNVVSEVFHSTRSLAAICEELIRRIVEVFGYPYGAITLYDENSNEVVALGEVDYTGKLLPEEKRQPFSKCFSGHIIKREQTIHVVGLSQAEGFEGNVFKEAGAETVLAVPLTIEGRIKGAIVLVDLIERKESSSTIDGLQAVANRLAIEIQRKQAEETLRKERNFTTAVLNNAGPLIIITDAQGRIERLNLACERLTGYTRKQAEGLHIWDYGIVSEEKDVVRNIFPIQPGREFPHSFEACLLTRFGQRRLISWSNSIMGEACEGAMHLVSIGIDITKKREAEEEAELRRAQLVEADKLVSLGILSSEIAHEINNPNNFIMLNAPLIRQAWEDVSSILKKYQAACGDFNVAGVPYSEMQQEMLKLFDGIEEGTERIHKIIQDMKSYAKKDVSDMNQRVDINEVVKAAMDLLAGLIKKHAKQIAVELTSDLPPVKGSFQRMEQVVVNLIQNACQALPDKSCGIAIQTSYESSQDKVVVTVSDDGVGINAEHLEHIFDPFFTTKSDNGGTGLGLSVCVTIVKEHEGELAFFSEVGNGTTVRLSLPADNAAA